MRVRYDTQFFEEPVAFASKALYIIYGEKVKNLLPFAVEHTLFRVITSPPKFQQKRVIYDDSLNDSFTKKIPATDETKNISHLHILTFLGKSPNAVAEEYPMLREPRRREG